ncbi:globin domain-containing protein [Erwinia sp. P6884]|uniref:globin domain-containing protein n=1 Tax=Erwinia sp. P6884 TaxID=3141450 RepID=UPI0031955E58
MLSEKQKESVKATVPVLKENGVALTDYFYKRMLNNHPELKETFNMGHQRSGAQAKALAGAVLAYAENIDNPGVLTPVIELICHKHVSLNIQTPDYDIVGENLLHSISEVLSIPMEDELITAWGAAYQQLADIFIATENRLYEEHKNSRGSWVGWRNFIVDRKVKESTEITSFYLIPEDGQALPDWKPGQYITLRLQVPALGIKQPRQYSLSNSPTDSYLRISVKREDPRSEGQDPGYVSSTLHTSVGKGDRVELSAPTGNFYLMNPDATNVLISAGVGLTPMISMVNHLLATHADPHSHPATREGVNSDAELSAEEKKAIYFIHAARNSDVHALREELKNLAGANNNLHLFITYEDVKEDEVAGRDYQAQGRLNIKELPAEYLPAEADYYLCGPAPFMQAQYRALTDAGIPADRIFSEAFSTGGLHL